MADLLFNCLCRNLILKNSLGKFIESNANVYCLLFNIKNLNVKTRMIWFQINLYWVSSWSCAFSCSSNNNALLICSVKTARRSDGLRVVVVVVVGVVVVVVVVVVGVVVVVVVVEAQFELCTNWLQKHVWLQ